MHTDINMSIISQTIGFVNLFYTIPIKIIFLSL